MAKIRLRTKTPREIRQTINRVMNMVINGDLDNKTANVIIFGCNAALSSIRIDEQQKKIDELEMIINDRLK